MTRHRVWWSLPEIAIVVLMQDLIDSSLPFQALWPVEGWESGLPRGYALPPVAELFITSTSKYSLQLGYQVKSM